MVGGLLAGTDVLVAVGTSVKVTVGVGIRVFVADAVTLGRVVAVAEGGVGTTVLLGRATGVCPVVCAFAWIVFVGVGVSLGIGDGVADAVGVATVGVDVTLAIAVAVALGETAVGVGVAVGNVNAPDDGKSTWTLRGVPGPRSRAPNQTVRGSIIPCCDTLPCTLVRTASAP